MTDDSIYIKECVIEILYRIDDLVHEYTFSDEECERKSADIVKKELREIMLKHLDKEMLLYSEYKHME